MSEVKAIDVRNPNPDLIECLEGLLADAKAGAIVGMAGASVFPDGTSRTFFISPENQSYKTSSASDHVLGALSRLNFQLLCERHGIDIEEFWYNLER